MTGMKRRDLLRLAAGAGALPVTGLAQIARTATSSWTPAFFDSHQNDTIVDFSDLVIPTTDTPGAKEALVNRFLDKILAASDHAFQNEFAGDLDTLDVFSRQTSGAEFVRLTPDQQQAVLEKMFLSPQRPSFDRLKAWTTRVHELCLPGMKA
jgi:gluconate 2-dehydrogenase gamma chain